MSCDDILRARRHGLTDKPASPPRNEEILPTFIAIQYEYDKRQTSVLCGVWSLVCAVWSVVPKLGWGIILSLIHVILRT